jgi:hypothetical protein
LKKNGKERGEGEVMEKNKEKNLKEPWKKTKPVKKKGEKLQ